MASRKLKGVFGGGSGGLLCVASTTIATIQYRQYSTVHGTAQHSTVHNTVQYMTTQPRRVEYNTVQYNTALLNPPYPPKCLCLYLCLLCLLFPPPPLPFHLQEKQVKI